MVDSQGLQRIGRRLTAAFLGEAENDVLAYMDFPPAHCVKLLSTDPIGRPNGELKRRTNVQRICQRKVRMSPAKPWQDCAFVTPDGGVGNARQCPSHRHWALSIPLWLSLRRQGLLAQRRGHSGFALTQRPEDIYERRSHRQARGRDLAETERPAGGATSTLYGVGDYRAIERYSGGQTGRVGPLTVPAQNHRGS
jgi:hypothetical protein